MGFKSAQSLIGIFWFPQFLQVLVFELLKQVQRFNGKIVTGFGSPRCTWAGLCPFFFLNVIFKSINKGDVGTKLDIQNGVKVGRGMLARMVFFFEIILSNEFYF